MRQDNLQRLTQAINLLHLDGHTNFTTTELHKASGLTRKTLIDNEHIVKMIDFAIDQNKGS